MEALGQAPPPPCAATVLGHLDPQLAATEIGRSARHVDGASDVFDRPQPKLPGRLSPAQAAQLSEAIDFLVLRACRRHRVGLYPVERDGGPPACATGTASSPCWPSSPAIRGRSPSRKRTTPPSPAKRRRRPAPGDDALQVRRLPAEDGHGMVGGCGPAVPTCAAGGRPCWARGARISTKASVETWPEQNLHVSSTPPGSSSSGRAGHVLVALHGRVEPAVRAGELRRVADDRAERGPGQEPLHRGDGGSWMNSIGTSLAPRSAGPAPAPARRSRSRGRISAPPRFAAVSPKPPPKQKTSSSERPACTGRGPGGCGARVEERPVFWPVRTSTRNRRPFSGPGTARRAVRRQARHPPGRTAPARPSAAVLGAADDGPRRRRAVERLEDGGFATGHARRGELHRQRRRSGPRPGRRGSSLSLKTSRQPPAGSPRPRASCRIRTARSIRSATVAASSGRSLSQE